MSAETTTAQRFTNWAGNQTCSPRAVESPASEAEVQALVRGAGQVRCVATGHSFSPVCATDGTLIRMDRMSGITGIDPVAGRVTALPGTPVGAFGSPLWDAGLVLENQGDIDTQGIAGAVATATHGSGLGLQSFSATVRRMRLVTADGDVLELGEEDARLPAAQVALGMLGVITEVELQAVPAHRLQERIDHWTWDEAWGRLDAMSRAHRHYSFFWIPAEGSAALYGLSAPEGATLADSCYVKIYDEAADSVPDSDEPGRRVGRSYLIYPMTFEPNFHELEYFVPYERGAEAVAAMRELMLARLPDSIFPMEVRTVAADGSWLSHSYERASVVISVSGTPGTGYQPYLRDVDRLLGEFDARVHWGKLHYLTAEQLHARYARAADFIALRRELDPRNVFLNDHLRELFA
ncbi:MAG TPA: D-arabinono-1,4-lactone oxidase [Gaiellales bacterium]|nr:D-arabinono-1,4-lactone oxidase [Gaiellales bacterium]